MAHCNPNRVNQIKCHFARINRTEFAVYFHIFRWNSFQRCRCGHRNDHRHTNSATAFHLSFRLWRRKCDEMRYDVLKWMTAPFVSIPLKCGNTFALLPDIFTCVLRMLGLFCSILCQYFFWFCNWTGYIPPSNPFTHVSWKADGGRNALAKQSNTSPNTILQCWLNDEKVWDVQRHPSDSLHLWKMGNNHTLPLLVSRLLSSLCLCSAASLSPRVRYPRNSLGRMENWIPK